MRLVLDNWQKEVLAETEKNIALRSGRQVGKSTIISIKAGEFAVNNEKKTILIIASVERQAQLLFEKTLGYIFDNHRTYLKKGKDKPTKHKIMLTNGSVIYCLPTGLSGYGIRGYTIDLLIADEAAFIPEDVWTAVTPMLAVTKGKIILLSTPHGKGGFYYNCFDNPNYKSFHISSEECPRADRLFLAREKARMSRVQYSQEYLGEFMDELIQFFPNELIRKVMLLDRSLISNTILPVGDLFLGADIARCGGDETVLIGLKRENGDYLKMMDMDINDNQLITETALKIKRLDGAFHYKKIYIDDGGMGVGVFDMLLSDEQTRRKVVAINNSARSLEWADKPKRKRLLKEDLYNNLLRLMEQGRIELFNDPEIYQSLSSIQYEYNDRGELKIFGNYTHIAESLIRAAWCVKDKTLNIWCG